jgi:hypothetical protein
LACIARKQRTGPFAHGWLGAEAGNHSGFHVADLDVVEGCDWYEQAPMVSVTVAAITRKATVATLLIGMLILPFVQSS